MPGPTRSSPANKLPTPARSRSLAETTWAWFSRRVASAVCSASMSPAGCEIVTKLPGTHPAISAATTSRACPSSGTGRAKSRVGAAASRIASGWRRPASTWS